MRSKINNHDDAAEPQNRHPQEESDSFGHPTLGKDWLTWCQQRFQKGYLLDLAGAHDAADRHYFEVITEIEELCAEHPSSISSYAFGKIALRHGAKLVFFGKYFSAEAAFLTALHSFDTTLSGDCSLTQIRELALTNSWLGRVRYLRGDFESALLAYRKAVSQWHSVARYQSKPHLRRRSLRTLAITLRGLSRTLNKIGQKEAADAARTESEDLIVLSSNQACIN